MIRVVFLKSRANFRGGLEKYTYYLMKAFVNKGCKVTLLTTGHAPSIEGVRSISVAPASKLSLYHLTHFDYACKKWLKKNPHEVIFGMERTSYQTHYRAGNGVHAVYLQRRKKYVDPFWKRLSFSFNPLHRKLLSIEKKVFEDTHLKVLFTNSQMVRNEILNNYSTSPEKIIVIHNGVEWDKWSDDFEQTFELKKKHPFHFLFIGNGYKRKGLLFLLQALEQFSKKDFHLTVIGKEKNPSFFIDWVEKKGLKKKVSFLGQQDNILPFFRLADALVLPSIYDPFANVTIEALAMGLYVVSSSFNGGKEILQDYSGTVIEELSSPISVRIALEKAYSHYKTEESARKIRYSVKKLDFSNQLDKIVLKTLQSI